jgi:hypothetical protein
MLNLAFIPEIVVEKFSFKQGFSKEFKPAIMEAKLGKNFQNKIAAAANLGTFT